MVIACMSIRSLSASVDSHNGGLFDNNEALISTVEEVASWVDLLSRIEAQNKEINACLNEQLECKGRLKSIRRLLTKGADLDRNQQINLVNRYINRFSKYRQDRRRVVSVADSNIVVGQRWSTLVEFLQRGGDCEDYATAKYQLLRLLGVPSSDLRVVVVYSRFKREHHALVAVNQVSGGMRLLDTDNLSYRSRPSKYRYVFALNENHVWDYGIGDAKLSWSVRRALKEQNQVN